MPGFSLRKNTVFDWNDCVFRIDRVAPDGDLFLERMDDGGFVVVAGDKVLADYREGRVRASTAATQPSESERIYSRPLEDLPAPIRQEVERRVQYVRRLQESGTPSFTPAAMDATIKEIAAAIGDGSPPSVVTLYRWYSRYRANPDVRALVPRFDRRGGRCKDRSRLWQLCMEAAQEAFAASPSSTADSVRVRLLAKVAAANRTLLPQEQLQPPSLRTVYRMLGHAYAFERTTLKAGKAAADKAYRLVRTGATTTNILERVEVDHTPLDLFLIDDKTSLPLGRPTLTVAIDHFSRMLLGYYLSFEGPSSAAVMGALRHAILPKETATVVLTQVKSEHQWPCYGRPDVLVVDNGLEFHGKDLESVAFDLDIRLQFCPKHQPRFKGVVERYLKTINYFFAHQFPGTSLARFHQRGDYDPQRHALLTMGEFKQLFEKWITDVYAQTQHRGIGTTPWAKWHEGLVRRQPSLPGDIGDLQRRIGLVCERSLRRDGIWLHGIRYSADKLQPVLDRFGVGVRVRVLFDPCDLGSIHVWGPDQDVPITAHALDQHYAKGLTARQNELIRTIAREEGSAAQDSVALEQAKRKLVETVQELQVSRHQRRRSRGAAIQGVSSANPVAELRQVEPKASGAPKKGRERGLKESEETAAPLPTYQSFRLPS